MLAAVVVGLAIGAPPAYAHAHLTRSSPAADATLTTAPTEIHLWFSEALEVSLTRVTLRGPDGETLPLGAVVADSGSWAAVAVAVRSPLAPGRYTVEWHIMATDGHPSSGTFVFTVTEARAPGQASAEPNANTHATAIGPPASSRASSGRGRLPADSGVIGKRAVVEAAAGGFDVGSPVYVAVRWVLYFGMLMLIGAMTFYWYVLGRLSKEFGAMLGALARARAATLGAAAAALVLAAVVGRLLSQSAVMGTAMGDASPSAGASPVVANLSMVLGTSWARSWWLQATAALVALAACLVARAREATTAAAPPRARPAARASWLSATLAGVTLALTPALSGHAAATPSWTGLAIIADAAHVLGAGGWLGTLLAVVIVGIPTALTLPNGVRGLAVTAVVNAFSPVALVSAGALTLTGVYAGIVHVGTFSALWQTDYGRTLLIKLGILTPVALTGLYNWRVVRPALGDAGGPTRVRRSAAIELVIGALVLVVTAVLVATPTPGKRATVGDRARRWHNAGRGPSGNDRGHMARMSRPIMSVVMTGAPRHRAGNGVGVTGYGCTSSQ